MFHSATPDSDKHRVLAEFAVPASPIRVLLATVAFGLGMDVPDIRMVINWELPELGLPEFH